MFEDEPVPDLELKTMPKEETGFKFSEKELKECQRILEYPYASLPSQNRAANYILDAWEAGYVTNKK